MQFYRVAAYPVGAVVTAAGRTFAVMVVENSRIPDDNASILFEGFPSQEMAAEFARRWTRDSVEELRVSNPSRDGLLSAWAMWGDNALVVSDGSSQAYNARNDIDHFVDQPATPEERDWHSVKQAAGVERGRTF